jgi:glycine oxidase
MLSPQGENQTPGPFFDLCLRSRSMYRQFAEELTDASGVDVEYKDEGTLFVVVEGENEEEKTKWTSWQLEAGLSLERLAANAVRKSEPAVTESATAAIFLPHEHQVENRRLMEALGVAMKRAGVQVIEGANVTALTTERGGITGVVSGGEVFEAGTVIVTAGAWSSRLLEPLGLSIKLFPARGQMIAVKGATCPITRVLHSSKVYLVPRRDGRILIGATVEYAGFRKAVTVEAVNYLLRSAVELVPSLKQLEIVETWSGLRPDTGDHLPIMGPSGVDNLLLATGHFRNGILLAPITAELVSELVTSGHPPDPLRPFGIDRFRPGQPEAYR